MTRNRTHPLCTRQRKTCRFRRTSLALDQKIFELSAARCTAVDPQARIHPPEPIVDPRQSTPGVTKAEWDNPHRRRMGNGIHPGEGS